MQNQESRSLLEKRLLGIAGEVAFVVDSEYWIEKVIENGRCFTGEESIIENGSAGRCHQNSIEKHIDNPDLKVCTGFSMNNGRWIRHSWCVDSNGVVHECTPIKRELYYGAVLDEEDTILLRKDWDFEFAAEMKKVELRRPFLKEKLSEAEDCKYFIRRCIDDNCPIDPEIELRRKEDIEGDKWTALKGELYRFKESFFRTIGKSPFEASLTDYKEEAMGYLDRTYPFCFGLNLRENYPELYYENAANLEIEFYALALGASDSQLDQLKQILKSTKFIKASQKGKLKLDRNQEPKKESISLDRISGSTIDSYEADNLYDALINISDKNIPGFIEYLMTRDYEQNPDKIFNGTCVAVDNEGNCFIEEGNHRVITAQALRAVKRFIRGESITKDISFQATVSKVRFIDKDEPSGGWEY